MIRLYSLLKYAQTDDKHEDYAVLPRITSDDPIEEDDNKEIMSRGSSSNNSSDSKEEKVKDSGDSS